MNMDIEKTGKDLQNKDTRKHAAGTIAGGVIGGVIGGYPGMQIGMAIGGYLFKPSSPNKKDYTNPDYKTSKSRIDTVPYIIGTDMCPGKVIYFNKNDFGVYDSGHLPSMEGAPHEGKWKEFINALADRKVAYWTEFAVNFSSKDPGYYGIDHIGVVKFNGKPFWFWLILSDLWENYDDGLDPYPPLTVLDAAQIEYYQNIVIEDLIGQDANHNTIMYFKGLFADFTATSTSPVSSNYTIDMNLLGDIKPEMLPAPLSAMPIFTAEMNTDLVWLSPESQHGGSSISRSGTHYYKREGKSDYSYGINMLGYWGCRDARNTKFVGIASTLGANYAPIYMEGSDRIWTYAGNDAILPEFGDPEPAILDWMYNNISIGGSYLQATDVIDDRVYLCVYRNWANPNQDQDVYGTSNINHHHTEYGVEFDLYYFDRTDPEYKVHSLIYNQRYDIPDPEGGIVGDSGSKPNIKFGSMVVGTDFIYIFGSRTQIDIVLSDKREIVSGDNSYAKIYADFSQYPTGWWEGKYAALGQNSWRIWRKITQQTSTYITIEHEFAAFPNVGSTVHLCKYPKWVAEWGVVGEGSTTTKIICNTPTWNSEGWLDSSYSGKTYWDACFLIGEWSQKVGCTISGTTVTLFSPLSRDPIPGERICFTMWISGDFNEYYTDPYMDEYISIFFHDLGFNSYPAKDDLAHLNSRRIDSNEFRSSHHVCLKIDKSTGAIELHDSQRVTTPTYYVGSLLTYTAQYLNTYACGTDVQAFVYSHEGQYGSQMAAYSYLLDFDTSNIHEQIHRRNNYSRGHAPMWCYMGCVPVKEWNEELDQYEDVWYTVLRAYDSAERTGILALDTDTIAWGTYFLRLGQGRFSNKQRYFDVINLYYGLDLDGDHRDIDVILFRKAIATGPLYTDTYTNSYPNEGGYQIGKFGITEDIYFYIRKKEGIGGTGIASGPYEMWRYTIPTENNKSGELYCISKNALWDADNNDLDFQWLEIGSTGSFRQCRYGWYGSGESGVWYQCDESPEQVVGGISGYSQGLFVNYFNSNNINTTEFKISISEASLICKEIIDATIYTSKEDIVLRERRFQFSQCYDQPRKFHDVLQEVLDTCQGFISPCQWEDGDFKLIIPNSGETPVHYFGLDSGVFVSTQESIEFDEPNIIYGDFSAYPYNYWKGDFVYYDEEKDHGNPAYGEPDLPARYRNWDVIIEQTSTYIIIGDGIYGFPEGEQFTLKKDNIKEGSFTFAEKSAMDRPNKVRIEFKNRLSGYIKDVAEAEDTYRLDILGETEKIDHYKMHGIKRATQAGRMAMRILDQWNHQRYVCAFETDIMGTTLCMGEIIGVGHDTTGWNGKWFRIVAMDELMDFEVKLELEEFNPYCYHDYGVPVYQGYSYSGFPTPYVPRNVERLEIKEDIEFNQLYFTFKSPARDAGFFTGARIYRKTDDDTWEFIAVIHETVSSVRLAQSVGIDDTTIYYDNDYLSGSFPSQGVIWIENELMYYHGIDTVNFAFTNVVRGYKDTEQVEHLIDGGYLYITLRDDATLYYEIPESWAGTTQTFKASSVTIHNLTIGLDLSPSFIIDIIGHGVLPYFPESIQNKIPETENIFESLGLEEDTIELTIEHVVEILGLGDLKVVTETLKQMYETIGLGDVLADRSIVNIIETLGLGDDKYQPYYVNVRESLGMGDSKVISESLVRLFEAIGLNDSVSVLELLTETIGMGDSKVVTETLIKLIESLGLDDDFNVIELLTESLGMGDDLAIDEVIDYITETLGLGDSKVVSETLTKLIESFGLGDVLDYIDDDEEIFDLETDFSEYITSSPPGDWTEHWHTTTFAMDIVTSPADTGGKSLHFDFTTVNNRSAVSWDDVGNNYNTEILCKVQWDTLAAYGIGPACRISGTSTSETGYVIWSEDSSNEISLQRFNNANGVSNLATFSFTMAVDIWYWVRMRVVEDNIKARIWADGDSEPETWGIDFDDTSPIYSMGKVGLGNYSADGFCDEFKVKILDEVFDYKTDFVEYSTPSDWSEHWHDANFVLSVATSGSLNKNTLNFNITSAELMACSWDDVGDQSDVEILTCITVGNAAAFCIGPGARLSGGTTDETGYIIWTDFTNDQIILRRYDAGTGSSDLATHAHTLDAVSWYWIRMVVVGNNIKARIWDLGSTEHDTWDIDYDDASPITIAGAVGLGNFSVDGYAHFFGVNIL
jgi:hypothetical protein